MGIDTLPLEWLLKRRFARTEINFLQETRHGDRLTLRSAQTGDTLLCEIRNPNGEAVCRIAFRMA